MLIMIFMLLSTQTIRNSPTRIRYTSAINVNRKVAEATLLNINAVENEQASSETKRPPSPYLTRFNYD